MIATIRNKHQVISGLLLAGLLAVMPTSACSLELQTVLENTRITPPDRVAFREERHNKLLKEPLLLTGFLEYLGAGRLRKVVETPFQESFLIEADRIEVERDGKTRKLSISKSKSMRAMLGGIEAVLAGQSDKLKSVFAYELSGTDSSWSLQLEPLSRKIAKQLSGLLIKGDDKSVLSIRFDLQGGEWHQMDILSDEPVQ